ncbi:MAG: hypothetical protein JOY62_14325 [Acidobacteriaceae bacterium]|nr:hypothetical protein [Acidobacteriaceae bacterium]MBV9781137.1 hypothetical protein [Acidobacteriaceae bacterium]
MRLGRQSVRAPKLPFPGAVKLRAAQIAPISSFDRVTAFPPEQWHDLQAFRPQVLVGLQADLLHLAAAVKLGGVDTSSVDHAVFVLTECGDQALLDVSRVVLWQTFGVPVYELLVGKQGDLLASECQAHQGWHIEANAEFFIRNGELRARACGGHIETTGLAGYIETATCACGRAGARVMLEPAPLDSETWNELAATA